VLALTAKSYPYLNLGCGGRFDERWTNIDFQSTNPVVIRHDLTNFGDGAFRVVYHSHLLEHLTCEQGRRLLEECLRVLEQGGVLRVVVPDLESATRAYLDALTRARLSSAAHADHKWMVIELIDQLTRTEPGGRMRASLLDPFDPEPGFRHKPDRWTSG
jgi:predicted SAM-dependent methyltransferase